MNPEELFETALAKVESQSIRSWANSAHNRPIFLGVCNESVKHRHFDPERLAANIVDLAISL